MARGTTYGAVNSTAGPSMAAIDSPAGPSAATKFAVDGPAGPVVGGPSVAWQAQCELEVRTSYK